MLTTSSFRLGLVMSNAASILGRATPIRHFEKNERFSVLILILKPRAIESFSCTAFCCFSVHNLNTSDGDYYKTNHNHLKAQTLIHRWRRLRRNYVPHSSPNNTTNRMYFRNSVMLTGIRFDCQSTVLRARKFERVGPIAV